MRTILAIIAKYVRPIWERPRIKFARHHGKTLLQKSENQNLRIFISTVIRGSRDRTFTGYLMELDWQQNRVKKKIPIPTNSGHSFWNARGGARGGRGLTVHENILYLATAQSVLLYDSELKQIGEINHPNLAGLHEIHVDATGIWLTSTVHDLVIKMDFNGNILDEFWGSENRTLQVELDFTSRELNLELNFPIETFEKDYEKYCRDERLHINAVQKNKDEIYILANRTSALIRIRPEPTTVVLRDRRLGSPHNILFTPDNLVIINDTRNQYVRVYDLLSGKRLKTFSTQMYRQIGYSDQFSKPGWQRGLAHVKGSIYLIGTSPATIFELDIEKGIIGQICKIDTDARHCVHGLTTTNHFNVSS